MSDNEFSPIDTSDDPDWFLCIIDRMHDISEEYKAATGNNQGSGTAHRPVAEQMRELYDCEKILVGQDPVEFENTTMRYLEIDLSAFVGLNDFGIGFSSEDFMELSLKERIAFRRKFHDDFVITTFEEVGEIKNPNSTFEFTFRHLGSLSNEEFEGFKSRLSELLWAAFSKGDPLKIQTLESTNGRIQHTQAKIYGDEELHACFIESEDRNFKNLNKVKEAREIHSMYLTEKKREDIKYKYEKNIYDAIHHTLKKSGKNISASTIRIKIAAVEKALKILSKKN
jgi:hypothetical protein